MCVAICVVLFLKSWKDCLTASSNLAFIKINGELIKMFTLILFKSPSR